MITMAAKVAEIKIPMLKKYRAYSGKVEVSFSDRPKIGGYCISEAKQKLGKVIAQRNNKKKRVSFLVTIFNLIVIARSPQATKQSK